MREAKSKSMAAVVEILRQNLLGLNQVMEQDDTTRSYRKCHKCNRPTFGHSKPGYGHKKCLEDKVIDNAESMKIWEGLYGKDNGLFAKQIDGTKVHKLFNCGICLLDFLHTEDFEVHKTLFHLGVTDLTCRKCQREWQTPEEVVEHMRCMHYFTCAYCGLYFHGKRE